MRPEDFSSASRKLPSYSFLHLLLLSGDRVLDVATDYKLGLFFFFSVKGLVPKVCIIHHKEASDYQYEESDEEVKA